MAIVISIITCAFTGFFVSAILAYPFWCAFQDFVNQYGRRTSAIKMAAYVAILVAVVAYDGWATFIDASRQEADPEGYAIEQAQREEGYYRVVALEEGGVRIVEDPNTGGLYARRETGSGKSRAVELAPLLDNDGTPMTVEDWEEVKENTEVNS